MKNFNDVIISEIQRKYDFQTKDLKCFKMTKAKRLTLLLIVE